MRTLNSGESFFDARAIAEVAMFEHRYATWRTNVYAAYDKFLRGAGTRMDIVGVLNEELGRLLEADIRHRVP